MKSDLGGNFRLIHSLILTIVLVLNCALLHAAESVGTFSKVEGSVDLMRGGALPALTVKTGDQVQTGDFIRTKSNARAEVTFKDGNVLKIAQRSRIDLAEYLAAGSGDSRKFNLPRGKVQAIVTKGSGAGNKGNRFEIHTPNAVAGVRGTDFFVFHDRNVTGILVKEGSVYAFNPKVPQNVITVPAGTITTVTEKGAPQPPRPATEAEKQGAEKETTAKPKGESKTEKKSETEKSSSGTASSQPANGQAPTAQPDTPTGSPSTGGADGPQAMTPPPYAPPTILPPILPPPQPPILPTIPTTEKNPDLLAPIKFTVSGPKPYINSTIASFTMSDSTLTYTYSLDGTTYQPFTGSISGLSDGKYTITFIGRDANGNASQPVTYSWAVDMVPPVLTGVKPIELTSTGTAPSFTAQSSDGTVQYRINGGVWQGFTGSISAQPVGTYFVEFQSIDQAGNVSTVAVSNLFVFSTPLGYVADIKANPMHRLSTIDPNSNLLTIVNQGNMAALLGAPTGLWSAASAPFTILGTYQGPGSYNNYWEGKIGSHNYATGGIDSADGASFSGFIGGSNLDTAGTTSGNLAAIYVAPRGGGQFGAGIIYGAFSGALGSGFWNASGTMNRFELNSAVSSSLSATLATDPTWWASNTTSVNPPPVTGPSSTNQKNYHNAEGFLLDSSFNISSRLSDRGDVLNLTLLKPDPTFGVWQRESFGRYSGSNTNLVLITDASVTQLVGGKTVPDHLFSVVSLGGWGANGDITGKAYGAWGDWEYGSARLLSGVVNGSYDVGQGTFGAVTNGGWLDVNRFLGLTTAERQLAGFPGIQGTSFTLSGSNVAGSVSLNNIRTFAHAVGDRLSLWATDSVSGTFSGAVPEGVQIAVTDGTSQISGSFRLERGGTSTTTGNQLWLAEIKGLGETTGPFRSSLNGIAAGTWSGSNFTGTAAGITHPITYYSSFGSTNQLLRYNGGAVYQSDGALYGVFGGMSLWGATQAVPSEFEIAGVHTPASFANQDYIFSTSINSFDVPTGLATTFDGGAYKGYLAGALARGTVYPEEPIDGSIAALYAAPDGTAGILTGKFTGYLDFNGVCESHGGWYPVVLNATTGSVSPSTWNLLTANLPLNVAQTGNFLGAGGGSISTVASIGGNSFDRTWISGTPQWGVWNLATSGNYSGTTYNQWFYMLSANDGNFFVDAEIKGNRWESMAPPPPATLSTVGKLKGDLVGNWVDISPAIPQTGILIGETVGTFDPIASRWQAVAVGAFMETNTFLQLAATTAGQAKLQQLNIPAFEIGSVDFSGSGAVSGGTVNVAMTGVKFFAPTVGGRPSIWATGNVSGNFTGTPATGNTVALSGSSATVSGLSPTLTIDSWSGSKWRASINEVSGSGTVGGTTNVKMFGKGAGSYSANSLSGTAVGSAK